MKQFRLNMQNATQKESNGSVRFFPAWLVLFILLFFNLAFRLFPVTMPSLRQEARWLVETRWSREIAMSLEPPSVVVSPQQIADTVHRRFVQMRSEHPEQSRLETEQSYAQLRDSYRDDRGQTYLLEYDPWQFARYVKNILKHGHPGESLRNGQPWDDLMLAPSGMPVVWDRISYYVAACLYRAAALFRPIPLGTFLFYLPLAYTAILIVVLYFLFREHGGRLGAFAGVLWVGMAPVFMERSMAGWFDKDSLSLLFCVLIVRWYLFFVTAQTASRRWLDLALASGLTAVFAATWNGWAIVLGILVVSELIFDAFGNRDKWRTVRSGLRNLTIYSGLSLAQVALICGYEPLRHFVCHLSGVWSLTSEFGHSVWPNAFVTVAELSKPSLIGSWRQMGGWVFGLACLPIGFFVVRYFKPGMPMLERRWMATMAGWLLSMAYAATHGIRFLIFLLIPIGWIIAWGVREGQRRKSKAMSGSYLLIAAAIGAMLFNGWNTSRKVLPFMRDYWYNALEWIRYETPPETIVNAWWDYGHWVKAVADRRVVVDNQTQDRAQSYWMAKALTENDETKALAILRILDNGGMAAFDELMAVFEDPLKAAVLFERSVVNGPLFQISGPAVLVVDDSLAWKMNSISYLANWSPVRAELLKALNRHSKSDMLKRFSSAGLDVSQIERLYDEALTLGHRDKSEWVSQRVGFYQEPRLGERRADEVLFDNGFVYRIKDKALVSLTGQVPQSFFTVEAGVIAEVPFQDANVNFSVFVLENADGYWCLLLDRPVANSLFVRLYFLEAMGLEHFRLIKKTRDGNRFIKVFEIDWD